MGRAHRTQLEPAIVWKKISGGSIADDRVPVKLSNVASFCAASRSRGQLGHASK
jgi:hypothetical protein